LERGNVRTWERGNIEIDRKGQNQEVCVMRQAMIPTYKAILRGNRLEWRGDVRQHIPADRAVTVYVTLVDELPSQTKGNARQQGAAMAAALARLAEPGALAGISDAAAWEREKAPGSRVAGQGCVMLIVG
jgi:hypothetical protein